MQELKFLMCTAATAAAWQTRSAACHELQHKIVPCVVLSLTTEVFQCIGRNLALRLSWVVWGRIPP